ncbi:hypothetical protein QX216_13505 [Vibrio parahaemolyticus]|uniref:hypothetical protein n=1 Tax=Vibrio parahaemolyticus TaxID=670 RepID=UPI00287ADAD4|nr:hypothetical protein [Vibrio parahaemolyticus]EJG1619291.1 hypothetical protein [Vibrio parahaemolyticus]MDS1796343.1 hypothetical protein [Vibrio parahaemolyticus]MDS1943113.1 hypothetical protein [Vibrio parahaemolyticus]
MRNVAMPKLLFSSWSYWTDRGSLENISYPGIYALAITSDDLTGQKMSFDNIVYIGMSNSLSGIKGRLNQLNRSINGGRGHSGGNTIRDHLGEYSDWKNDLDLYVSICPIICDVKRRSIEDLKLMGAVSYMEYEAFSLFRSKNPALIKPKYNKQ